MKYFKFSIFAVFLLSLLLTGCSAVKMQSQWTKPTTLSSLGEHNWPESPQYFDKNSKILVSLMNDKDSLYIRLVSRNQSSKMLFLRSGFTVWIDDTGNTDKKYGFQFEPAMPKMPQRQHPDQNSNGRIEELLKNMQYSLIILNEPENTRQTIQQDKAAEMGIYVQLAMQQGYLIYKMKIPLTMSENSNMIGVGFETGAMKHPGSQNASFGAHSGMGGGRGGGSKKMGGKNNGSQRRPPASIDIWVQVHLADKKE